MTESQTPDSSTADAEKPQTEKPKLTGMLKLAVEFGPLLVFFAAFQGYGLIPATAVFMAAMVVAVIVSYAKTKHVPPMLWANFILISLMGGLTLYLNDETFVKMKPTMLFSLFAVALVGAERFDKLIIKSVMSGAMPPVPDSVWRRLTWGLAAVYAGAALLNEWIWRSFSTEVWVNIKVFGMFPGIMVATIALTMVMIMPYFPDEDGNEDSGDTSEDQ